MRRYLRPVCAALLCASLSLCQVSPLLAAEGASLTDGTYQATANGMDGEIVVEVSVADGQLSDIAVVEDNETAGVGDKALQIIPEQVLAYQSLGVDNVSGATISSMAIKSALADAITQAGGDAAEWKSKEVPSMVEDGEYTYDVVVVGAGLAGLTAALSAEKQGAKVALLEKLGIAGGTSIFSSGNFLAAGTEELIPEVAQNWNERNKLQEVNVVNMDLVNNLLAVSPKVLSFYGEIGVDFSYDEESYTASPVPSDKAAKNAETIEMATAAVKVKGGEALIASLVDALVADGVEIFYNTPATSLLQEEDGTVTGVVSETEKYGKKVFHAANVILSTGDYARNQEMNAQLAPETVGEYTSTAVSNTGDGLTMALEAGAVLHAYQESMSGNFNADPFDMPVAGQPNNQFPFSILLVDRNGERKVSEAAGPHAQQVFFIYEDSPDYAWAVFDEEIAGSFIDLDTFLSKCEAGSPIVHAYKADTIEELAEKMGVESSVLQETVDHYNALCEAGEDTDFGKAAEYLSAIDAGPFYAVQEYDSTRGNYGGILTNERFEVVKEDGEAIPGLYAIGVLSSGDYFGDYYPGREALSLCAHGGYIAGILAAGGSLE